MLKPKNWILKDIKIGGEFVGEENHFYFKTNKKEDVVIIRSIKRPHYIVLWNGALDFEGNKRNMLRTYPEIKRWFNKKN